MKPDYADLLGAYAELVDQFGKKVADVVMEVTDDKSLEKAERKHPEIEHAPHLCKRATLVKLTDKTCNLRDVATRPPADWPLKRQQGKLRLGLRCGRRPARRQQEDGQYVPRGLRAEAVTPTYAPGPCNDWHVDGHCATPPPYTVQS